MTPLPTNDNHSSNDDEYKKATKEVVDDMLRDDVLGPRICAVLTNHTPASEKIKVIIADAVAKEPSVKQAIENIINDLDSKRKSRWIDKLTGAFWTIVIGVIIFFVEHFLINK